MNFIQISLFIGLVIITVEKGYTYFKIRNNEDGKETSPQQKEARNSFLRSLAVVIIYACIKLSQK